MSSIGKVFHNFNRYDIFLVLMTASVIKEIEQSFKKPHTVDVKSGDTVRVHQKIREGGKERVQVFEGLVIQTKRKGSLSSSITVRRIASGIGVEKTFMIHSPLVTKIQVVKRSKVRRNYLSYMRERTGKSARLSAVNFDQDKVNYVPEIKEEPKAEASQETESQEKTEDKPEAEKADKQPEEKAQKPSEQKTEETGTEASKKEAPEDKK
jgi:large subunit ribosomal protein L19